MTNLVPVSDRRAVALAFLERVLPLHGMYFAAIKFERGKGLKRVACTTLTELWNVLSGSETDTYFSTASFRDNTSSAAANIEALQAFRLDVDCGHGKPQSTAQSGMIGVLRFAQSIGLPPPGFVLSGSGVHAWWPLTAPLSCSAWERYAEGLKRACKTHGLDADQAVTMDAARILRCPGTFNHKRAPVEVELHSHFFKCGPYDLTQFTVLVDDNVIDLHKPLDTPPVEPPPSYAAPVPYCQATLLHYASMLSAIPPVDREDRQIWFETGAALYELGWGEGGFKLWSLWSRKSAKYDEGDQHATWESFARPYPGPKITPGSLAHRAAQHGWVPLVASPPPPIETSPPVEETGSAQLFSFPPAPAQSSEQAKKKYRYGMAALGSGQNQRPQLPEYTHSTCNYGRARAVQRLYR